MTNNKGFNLNKFYSRIHQKYDLINKLFTFGLDRKWRRITIKKCLEDNPENILDLCTGTGDLAITLAKRTEGKIKVIGYDMNRSMLEQASLKAKDGDANVEFVQGNASQMPFSENTFDRITIGFGFRNLTFSNPDEDKHVQEIFRVLKSGGKLLILESAVPKNPLVKLFYLMHLYLILIPLGGVLSGDFKAYWYLAHSSSSYYSSKQLKSLLTRFGFKNVSFKKFLLGAANLVIAEK